MATIPAIYLFDISFFMKNKTPTEYEEAIVLAEYLTLNNYKFTHLAQETYTPHWGVRMKNKRMGVKAGIPDYMIILPERQGLLFIELKREKGGKLTPDQKSWIDALNGIPNVEAIVCYGSDSAIECLKEYS
jgi:hypothetical protein